MDAVFVNPLPGGVGLNQATIEPPLGLAYLAAVLERDGFECSIIDANALELDSPRVVERIPQSTRLIGFYINSFSYEAVSDLAKRCRQRLPEAIVVLGGPLASAIPQELLAEIDCHGVISGEGEHAVARMMANIAEGRSPFDSDVSGAVYRDTESGEVVVNPSQRIKDLDALPFPAYHLLPPLTTYKSRVRKKPMAAMVTSRGCPHQCTFCSQDVFQRRVTFRSAQNVLDEVDFLVKELGVRQIDVLDDNFAVKRSRVEEILDGLIERNYDLVLNLQLGIRPETLDDDLLRKMKAAGVYKLGFGIESADPEVLRLCCKKLDVERTAKVVQSARRLGMVAYGFFIIGLPGETEEAFQRTIKFAKETDFDVANFCMAVPFIGTGLYRQVEAGGRFLVDTTRNIDSGFYGGRVFFEYGNTKREDLLDRYERAYKAFYTLGKKVRMLAQIRSWTEFCWHVDAALFVIKGVLRSRRGQSLVTAKTLGTTLPGSTSRSPRETTSLST